MKPPRRQGVPAAIGKPRRDSGPPVLDWVGCHEAWTLELLAFIEMQQLPARVDLRGARSAMPPVVLATPSEVIAYDLWPAIAALHSRPRSFSQVAGRYAPLVIGAQDGGKRLRIQWWQLRSDEPAPDPQLAVAVAKYLQADVTLHDMAQAQARVVGELALPPVLLERNPVAWSLVHLHANR